MKSTNGDVVPAKPKKEEVDLCADGFGVYVKRSVKALLFENSLNIMMLAMPLAIFAEFNEWSDGIVFGLSLLAIAPFAERLSFVTEQLALHTSQLLGGLLNATFGNVTELIVSFFALKAGMLRIVQVSLLGSILSNLLLVLGCAFFAGGQNFLDQKFNSSASAVNISMLVFFSSALLYPAMFELTHEDTTGQTTLMVSRCMSILMLITYLFYIFFQLFTHSHLYEEEKDDDNDDDEEDDDEEEPILGVWGAIFWLAVITVAISLLSEYMVDSLEAASENWGVPDLFLGTIVIPIVGNAAEHAAAVIFGVKNKMELAIGIAVGSSIQIAVFCVPFLILVAWSAGSPLSLNFGGFETGVLVSTIIFVGFVIQNGQSNWLMGQMLVTAYFVVATGFFVHVDPAEMRRA